MKLTLFVFLYACASSLYARDYETVINNAEELKVWCENESSQYFIAQDITPYNWTASWWNEGGFLNVKGSWRINGKYIDVHCRIKMGVSRQYANITINKKSINYMDKKTQKPNVIRVIKGRKHEH